MLAVEAVDEDSAQNARPSQIPNGKNEYAVSAAATRRSLDPAGLWLCCCNYEVPWQLPRPVSDAANGKGCKGLGRLHLKHCL